MAASASSLTSPLPPRPASNGASAPTLSSKMHSSTSVKATEKFPTQSLTASASKTAAEMTPAKAASMKKKKKKRHSPFRIKVGCIVALRYRAGGNNLKRVSGLSITNNSTLKYAEVWTDPMPNRDDGLALIGRRVRCCFPKSVLKSEGVSTRILEGEVISLIDYDTCWQAQREKRRLREPCSTAVELLVDKKSLQALPFLERTDEDVDTSNMSSSEKKRQEFQEIIRGKNMVTVKVNLADASKISVDKRSSCDSDALVAKWVLRKRVPLPSKEASSENGAASDAVAKNDGSTEESKPLKKRKKRNKDDGKLPTTLYVGDKNDPQAEQERNWRWLAGRYDEFLLLSESGKSRPPEQLSSGIIGEVLKVEPTAAAASGTNGSTTLATVTLRRMILPEHSISGRQSHHGAVEMFDDADAGLGGTDDNANTFQVPVEELVIISRKFERKQDTTNGDSTGTLSCPVVTRSYSYRSDSYRRLASGSKEGEQTVDVCHRCRKAETKGSMELDKFLSTGKDEGKLTCHDCQTELRKSVRAPATLKCDCQACLADKNDAQEVKFKVKVEKAFRGVQKSGDDNDDAVDKSALVLARSAVRAMRPFDFDLPNRFMEFQSLPQPSEKPITVATKPKRARKTPKKTVPKASMGEKGVAGKKQQNGHHTDSAPKRLVSKVEEVECPSKDEEEVFVPTCSRLTPYDPARKRQTSGSQMRMDNDSSSNQQADKSLPSENGGKTPTPKQAPRKRKRESDRMAETKSTSRAARADQRRLKRGVAALGASNISLDALAGREQQLRFDRSSIHAWGVFADEDINAGDMVVEYRGELIGNAMAEKREVEYEKAKIGSDYMFRMDAFMVCDATKQGNVARFINASCDPNCYTQIITLNGNKRIVIYAKKDIKAGEELCYDYKFPFEYDEAKRIPCHCGAKDCRGFMNWDKRYVNLPAANTTAGQENKS